MIMADSYFNTRISQMWEWNVDGSLYSSLIVMLVLIILGAIIGIKCKKGMKTKAYLKKPKGFMHLAEIYFNYIDNFTKSNMGEQNEIWGGYLFTLFAYLFVAFMVGATGFPSIVDWMAGPLCLSIIMFVLIQFTAIRYQHWSYFHRYIEPIAVFLPVNLITMWAPIISTTMRLFGNAISGFVLIGMVQWASAGVVNSASQSIAEMLINGGWQGKIGIVAAPAISGVLQLYFTLFSGAIQTLVFGSLNAVWIAAEIPDKHVVSPALNDRARPDPVQE